MLDLGGPFNSAATSNGDCVDIWRLKPTPPTLSVAAAAAGVGIVFEGGDGGHLGCGGGDGYKGDQCRHCNNCTRKRILAKEWYYMQRCRSSREKWSDLRA
jgi:hypothetical protein